MWCRMGRWVSLKCVASVASSVIPSSTWTWALWWVKKRKKKTFSLSMIASSCNFCLLPWKQSLLDYPHCVFFFTFICISLTSVSAAPWWGWRMRCQMFVSVKCNCNSSLHHLIHILLYSYAVLSYEESKVAWSCIMVASNLQSHFFVKLGKV